MAEDTLYEPVVKLKVDESELDPGLRRAEAKAKAHERTVNELFRGRSSAYKNISDALGSIEPMLSKMTLGIGAAAVAMRPVLDMFTRTSATIEEMNAQLRVTETRLKQVYSVMSSTLTMRERAEQMSLSYQTQAAILGVSPYMRAEAGIQEQERIEALQFATTKAQLIREMSEQLQGMNEPTITLEEFARQRTNPVKEFLKRPITYSLFGAHISNRDVASEYYRELRQQRQLNRHFIEQEKAARLKELEAVEAERKRARQAQAEEAKLAREFDTTATRRGLMFERARAEAAYGYDELGAAKATIQEQFLAQKDALWFKYRGDADPLIKEAFQVMMTRTALAEREFKTRQEREVYDLVAGERIAGLRATNDPYGTHDYAIALEQINRQMQPLIDEQTRIIETATDRVVQSYARQKKAVLESTQAQMEAEAKKNEALRQMHMQMGRFASWGTGTMSSAYGAVPTFDPGTGSWLGSRALTPEEQRRHFRALERNTARVPNAGRGRRY